MTWSLIMSILEKWSLYLRLLIETHQGSLKFLALWLNSKNYFKKVIMITNNNVLTSFIGLFNINPFRHINPIII